MGEEGSFRLLPVPRHSGQFPSAEILWATSPTAVVSHPMPPQSEAGVALESGTTDFQPLDPNPSYPASLSGATFLRYSSEVGAVCVNAPVRICAGGVE